MAEETVAHSGNRGSVTDVVPTGRAGRLGLPRIRAGIVVPCVGLLIALVLPILIGRLRGNLGIEAIAIPLAITAILLVYILLVERRSISSIGLRLPTRKSFAFGIAVGVILLAGMGAAAFVVFPALHLRFNQAALDNLVHTPWWFRFLLVTRAAVFEEVCFRGYAIERVQELTGRKWIAFVVSVAVFTYGHLRYWGWAQLIPVGFAAVVLALYYIWRRDLASNMIAHFVTDGAGLLFS